MTTHLMSLETLKAKDASLSALITCTEHEVSLITTRCLLVLKQNLDGQPQSRKWVTDAVVALWTATHVAFFRQHEMQGPQMDRVYELSGTWLRQRLLAGQLFSHAVPAVNFAQYVTVGTVAWEDRPSLYGTLLQVVHVMLSDESLGWDAAVFASSEVLADTVTELYRICQLPYELDLWPLVANLISWEELLSAHSALFLGF